MKNKLSTIINLNLFAAFIVFLQVGCMYAGLDTTGQARLFQVMYQGPGGIESVNKHTRFADVKNLSFDLNLAEISQRFGCKTKLGQGFILHALTKPVSSFDTSNIIKNRQHLIQFFRDNPAEQEKFESLLQQAVEHEAVIMKFMQNRTVPDASYNPFEFLDYLKARLPLFNSYGLWMSSVDLARQGSLLAAQVKDAWGSPGSFFSLPYSQQVLLTGLSVFGLTATDFGKDVFPVGMQEQSKASIAYQRVPFTAYATGSIMAGLYKHYAKALMIRNALYSLNRLVDIARQLEAICDEYDVQQQFKLSFIRSEKGMELLDNLQASRYQTKEGLMSYVLATPWIHTLMYDVYEYDMNLAPLYTSIAELDAYIAIAKKMTELQDADHTFTFAEFLDDAQPKIDAQGFWNLLVPEDKVVTNSMNESRNIILTGANEGGKTTAIRSILQNIVLAQTFGIAAASKFVITQFDIIHSYLNVADDILHGKSRYGFELQQASEILDRVKSLQPEQKYFFAFDELFTGTNGEDGADIAYDFINNIASHKGIQFIYATHFNKLKTIGANNPACANYKIDPPLRNAQGQFVRDNKGQLIYPYTLSPGANNVNVAKERAIDAGIFA